MKVITVRKVPDQFKHKKSIKATCDNCGKVLKPADDESFESCSFKIRTFGYSTLDGEEHLKWDICSPMCGINLVEKHLQKMKRRRQ